MNITAKTLCFTESDFAYHVDLSISPALTLFAAIQHLPWAIWLDSCHSDHVDSRYDILVWAPSTTLCTQDKNTTITCHDGCHASCLDNALDKLSLNMNTIISQDDPLVLVDRYQSMNLKDITLDESLSPLPFKGGALGYLSYDLGRRFEQLPSQAQHDITLPDMAIGLYNQAIIIDNKTQEIWLICPEAQRDLITIWLSEKLALYAKKVTEPLNNFSLLTPWQANMNKEQYSEKFNTVQGHLLAGDCYQINLAQRFSSQYQGDEFSAYIALRTANNAPFSAFMRFDQSAVLSISPERFLQLHGDNVQSKPIKGTKPRHFDKAIDIHNADALKISAKDQAENVMIVDLLRNDISKVCIPGSVKVPKLFDIESFPAVHHLVSTVEGTLSNRHNAYDLLRACFPGGSITGAPKIRAMEIIETIEPHRRNIYCGSIGYISHCGNMDTNISIRTLVCEQDIQSTHDKQTKENNIYCWAGGGLVADSTVDSEYQETYDKVERILPILSALS
jgi:para-aminobenzoate synthetase component 1